MSTHPSICCCMVNRVNSEYPCCNMPILAPQSMRPLSTTVSQSSLSELSGFLTTTSNRLATLRFTFLWFFVCTSIYNSGVVTTEYRRIQHTDPTVFQPALDRILFSSMNEYFHPQLVPLDLIRPERILDHVLLACSDSYVPGCTLVTYWITSIN